MDGCMASRDSVAQLDSADDDQLDRFGSIVPTSTCAEYFKSALLLALAVGSLGSSTIDSAIGS